MPHLFPKFLQFMLPDFLASFFNNAAHISGPVSFPMTFFVAPLDKRPWPAYPRTYVSNETFGKAQEKSEQNILHSKDHDGII
jgi:uncharacterized protein YyaL (SSP411 family)